VVSEVRTHSPGVIAGREQLEAARAQLAQAQRAWLPSGELTVGLTGSPNVRCLDADSDVPNPDRAYRESHCIRTNVVALNNQPAGGLADVAPIHGVILNLALTLNQPLYSFGRLEAQLAIAQAQVAAAEAGLLREQAEIEFTAARAYWGVKAARAAVDTLTDASERLREWLDKIDSQINGANPSKYTESDLARLKLALANLEILLADQRRNKTFAEEGLRILTQDTDADVDEAELELDDSDGGAGLEAFRARALRLRPEVQQFESFARTARAWRQLKVADFFPELLLTSSLGYGYASSMDTPQNWYLARPNFLNANLGLLLRQPLDFGGRHARYAQARHDEAANEARLKQVRSNTATDVAQAHANLEEARRRLKETERGERVSRGWYHAIDQNLSAGLYTDGREMTEAARSYFEFRLRRLQAIFDSNVARAWLRRVVGESESSPERTDTR
jgi:outer membrane protein TolC